MMATVLCSPEGKKRSRPWECRTRSGQEERGRHGFSNRCMRLYRNRNFIGRRDNHHQVTRQTPRISGGLCGLFPIVRTPFRFRSPPRWRFPIEVSLPSGSPLGSSFPRPRRYGEPFLVGSRVPVPPPSPARTLLTRYETKSLAEKLAEKDWRRPTDRPTRLVLDPLVRCRLSDTPGFGCTAGSQRWALVYTAMMGYISMACRLWVCLFNPRGFGGEG